MPDCHWVRRLTAGIGVVIGNEDVWSRSNIYVSLKLHECIIERFHRSESRTKKPVGVHYLFTLLQPNLPQTLQLGSRIGSSTAEAHVKCQSYIMFKHKILCFETSRDLMGVLELS